MYPDIHSSFICDRQKLKAIQVCINSRHGALSHAMEYYTAIKRDELLITRNSVFYSQSKRKNSGEKRHSVYVKFYKIQTVQKANQIALMWAREKWIIKRYKENLWLTNTFIMLTAVMALWIHICVSKLTNCIFFKYMQFIVNSLKKFFCVCSPFGESKLLEFQNQIRDSVFKLIFQWLSLRWENMHCIYQVYL